MNLDNAINSIIQDKQASGRAVRTIADYRRVLNRFAEHVDHDITTWTRATVREYVAGLRENGWAQSTVGLHVRYLRAFWRWLYEEGYLPENFATAIDTPKRTIREEPLLTTEEFTRLVVACNGDRFAERDRAILLLMVDTGMRRGEFAALQRDWLHFEDGGAWILLPSEITKNREARYVLMGGAAARALRTYLDSRDDDDPALFVGDRGPMGGDGLWYMLNRRAEAAGLDPDRVHPHLLRKVFASWWIENGGDEQRLMRLGGWSGPEMLRVYVRLGSREALQRAHQKYSPVDRALGASDDV
jgi:site-specific recombinase XerD